MDTGPGPSQGYSRTKFGLNGSLDLITLNDYHQLFWPLLKNAIGQLLTVSPGISLPFSYEELYSCVYKIVCKGFAEVMFEDLMSLITESLTSCSLELHQLIHSPKDYINRFDAFLQQYTYAISGIVPIFIYMNRFYIESELKTDLKSLLLARLKDVTLIEHVPLILEALNQPCSADPSTASQIINSLHQLDPGYRNLDENLFSRFIPKPAGVRDITRRDEYIMEARRMVEQISRQQPQQFGIQQNKRRSDVLESEDSFQTSTAGL